MSDILIFIGIAGFFGLGMVVTVMTGARQLRRAGDNLRDLGQRLGLAVHEPPRRLGWQRIPELRGIVRGKAVRIHAYTTGSGKSRTHWAAVSVTPARPSALVLRLSPQGWGAKLLSIFGAREIEVGDPSFDRAWFVQTSSPDFTRAALLPEVRSKLDELRGRGASGSYDVGDGMVRYAERGWFTDCARIDRFVGVVDVACDLADIAEVHAAQATG